MTCQNFQNIESINIDKFNVPSPINVQAQVSYETSGGPCTELTPARNPQSSADVYNEISDDSGACTYRAWFDISLSNPLPCR